jgi:predicted nucleic acid-binding Zn finger protein
MSLDEIRLLANVNARAKRLFENGYRADRLDDHLIEVTSPQGETYEIDTVSGVCSCPFYRKHQGRYGCKHLTGCEKLLADQEERQRHNARQWEALA